jgi:flagellar biogenesis protein FliO
LAGRLKLNLKLQSGDAAIKKGETIHLGHRKFLSVVDVKDRTFLLAIGQDQVSLLYHWEKEKREEGLS